MNRIVVSVVLVVMLAMAAPAPAALINGIQSSYPTQGLWQSPTGGFAGSSGSGSLSPVQNSFYAVSPTPAGFTPWAWVSANATDLFLTMGPEIQILSSFGTQSIVTTYAFRVTLTNNTAFPISPVQFRLVNDTVPAADFDEITFTPLSWHTWDGTATEAAYMGSLQNQYHSTYNTAFEGLGQYVVHFGGLSGGGGQLLPGDMADFYFGLTLGDMSNDAGGKLFWLTLVPSPEPTSLMLGAFGLIGGVLLVRRRRNKKPAQDAQPQA